MTIDVLGAGHVMAAEAGGSQLFRQEGVMTCAERNKGE